MDAVKFKNDNQVVIRQVEKKDARELIDFFNIVGGETDYLSFGGNEFMATVDIEEKYIEDIKNEENSNLILAVVDGKIIGTASITSSQKRKTKHVGTLGIVIKKEYCGLGIGSILIDNLINWSKLNGITKKITLITRCDNSFAIELYKKKGFEIEGTLKRDSYENDVYYDVYIMGLIF
jgi:RimJ/RimL family protein N-acetyltransferase